MSDPVLYITVPSGTMRFASAKKAFHVNSAYGPYQKNDAVIVTGHETTGVSAIDVTNTTFE